MSQTLTSPILNPRKKPLRSQSTVSLSRLTRVFSMSVYLQLPLAVGWLPLPPIEWSKPHPRSSVRPGHSVPASSTATSQNEPFDGWQRVSKQHVTIMMTATGGARTDRDELDQTYESCAGERNYWRWAEQGPNLRIITPLTEAGLCSFCKSFAELELCCLSCILLFWGRAETQHKIMQQASVSKAPFISALQVSWSL